MNLTRILPVALFLSACSFVPKDASTQADPKVQEQPKQLRIEPEDWKIEEQKTDKLTVLTRTLLEPKKQALRKDFRMPALKPVSIFPHPGYEIYEITGYPELETSLYIHPKLYIQSAIAQGSILGYRVDSTSDNVEISIPIALVDGLAPALAIPGAPKTANSNAVSLPPSYLLSNKEVLEGQLGKPIKNLPVCPREFRLVYEGKQLHADSPFGNQSTCPTNQIFRVTFKAPTRTMRHILDLAAIQDGAVSLHADLEMNFKFPSKQIDLTVGSEDFLNELKKTLATYSEVRSSTYPIADVEYATAVTLKTLANPIAPIKFLDTDTIRSINEIVRTLFSPPSECPFGGVCRTMLNQVSASSFRISWAEMESMGTPLRTLSASPLGAVANASKFISNPVRVDGFSPDMPELLKGLDKARINEICKQYVESKATPPLFKYATAAQIQDVSHYCYHQINPQEDYTPFGNNTVVFPGAWLKIDIDELSELTSAKTRVNSDGTVSVQSEVIDLLANQPGSQRTSCTEGSTTACLEYKKTTTPILNVDGSPARERTVCAKEEEGRDGCICEKKAEQEICYRYGKELFQEVLDHSCKPEDEVTYCPFYRTEETVVDYDVQYNCEEVVTEEKNNFLNIGGSTAKREMVCKENNRKPLLALRQVQNCKEDENERLEQLRQSGVQNLPERRATAHRMTRCLRPQYKCARWNQACTRYAVNEALQIVHQEPTAKWRPFAVENGEFPPRFEEDIYLKFVSPSGRVATNCRLSEFQRELRGGTLFIKLPTEANETTPCDIPIWDKSNTGTLALPKVFIKNSILYAQKRLCGKTEYSFLTKELPQTSSEMLIPGKFAFATEVKIGPIEDSCQANKSVRIGNDLWFTEYPPVRFSGRVSVLGKALESIFTEVKP
jgi:hypothetical protein